MRRNVLLFAVALGITVVVATVVVRFASDQPDGLEYVAEQQGFADTAEDHALGDAPLADYGDNLAGDGSGNRAIAGAVGVAVTLGLGAGLFWLIRANKPGRGETAES